MSAGGAPSKPMLVHVPVGNNPARVRFLIYYKQLEDEVAMVACTHVNSEGRLSDESFKAMNPQGKVPALLLPSGEHLFEANVIAGYLNDVFGAIGPRVGASTPEDRARSALIVQVHDIYIASPNSSDPNVTSNQSCMYKSVQKIDATARAAKFLELWKQLGVLESLVRASPYAVGEELTLADITLWPTLAVFFALMLPKYGWANPMDNEEHFPKLKRWHAAVGALPAAQRIVQEMEPVIRRWETVDRLFEPILEQVRAHPELKWVYP